MPLTKTGTKVLAQMKKQYGAKKGKEVFYASITAGKKGSAKWHEKKKGGKLAKAKRTYAKKKKKKGSAGMKGRIGKAIKEM